MRIAFLFSFILFSFSSIYSQKNINVNRNIFDSLNLLDPSNKVVIDLNSVDKDLIIIQEKDYLVSSDRLKYLTSKEELKEDYILIVIDYKNSQSNINWIKFIKVLINDKNLLKLKSPNTKENITKLYVNNKFDLAYYHLLASKIECPFTIINE